MRVLVTYGSKLGGTEGLAERVGRRLSQAGHAVEVRRGRAVRDVRSYDAVVIGGALYMLRWVGEARRVVTLNADELATKPVWFFSSGPLDDSATSSPLPPTKQVAKLMAEIGARGHITFGGRLEKDAKGFMASSMARGGHGGDFRDWQQVDAWADSVAEGLRSVVPVTPKLPSPGLKRWLARAVVLFCLFTGLTALAGGLELIAYPRGAPWMPSLSVLEGTAFSTFTIPGVLLATFVGLPNLVAAIAVLRRRPWSGWGAVFAGCAIASWIVGELLLLRAPSVTEAVYLVLGVATVGLAAWWLVLRRALRAGLEALRSPAAA